MQQIDTVQLFQEKSFHTAKKTNTAQKRADVNTWRIKIQTLDQKVQEIVMTNEINRTDHGMTNCHQRQGARPLR